MKITSQRIEVMVWWLLMLLPLSTATLCRTGHQFWNETLGKCVDCTKCTQPGDLVLRPCQIHQDTLCGPFSSLNIDWSFLGRSHKQHRRPAVSHSDADESSEHFVTSRTDVSSSEEFETRNNKKPHHKKWPRRGKHHHKKHHSNNHNKTRSHHHHHHHKFEWSSSEILPENTNSSEFEDVFSWVSSVEHHKMSSSSRNSSKSYNHHRNSSKTHRQRPESASQLKELKLGTNVTEVQSPELGRTGSSEPFSATEELVWDWQAVALGLAVFACMFFFLVACVYSVHHARQWKRLKDHFEDFEADVGELSTRLSLLLPTLQNEETGAVSPDCCANPGQCLYLEKLLARKRQIEEGGEHGNVYIDRDVASCHRA